MERLKLKRISMMWVPLVYLNYILCNIANESYSQVTHIWFIFFLLCNDMLLYTCRCTPTALYKQKTFIRCKHFFSCSELNPWGQRASWPLSLAPLFAGVCWPSPQWWKTNDQRGAVGPSAANSMLPQRSNAGIDGRHAPPLFLRTEWPGESPLITLDLSVWSQILLTTLGGVDAFRLLK